VLFFNMAGLIMTAIAFAAAFGIGAIFGINAEGPLMIIAGPLAAALDLGYRWNRADARLLAADAGGSLLFLPVWMFGALWFVLGVVYTIQGKP
jgi:hypothetical protein